jgi:hypothetical protein
LVYLLILLFSNSYIIQFREFYFLPFSVDAQTNIIYVNLLSLLWWVFNNCINLYEPCVLYIRRAHRYPPNTPSYIFFQQISILNF